MQYYDKSTIPLIAGFTAGLVSTTVLLPLDIVKLRLQVTESSNKKHRFRFFRVAGGILKYEGIRGLYQGWTPAVIGSSISWGGYFFFYEEFKRQLVRYKIGSEAYTTFTGHSSDVLTSIDNFVLAVAASSVMVAITNPVWLVKTRMQLQMRHAEKQNNIRSYDSMVDAFRTIVREEGPFALYRGVGPAFLLTSHGGVQFTVYEALRKNIQYNKLSRQDAKEMSVWQRLQVSAGYLSIGAASKLIATTITYPLQLIKARIQQRSNTVELTDDGTVAVVKRQYNDIRSTCVRIWQLEGFGGFFKGCIPNAFRVMPAAAITFVVYEEVTDLLNY